MDLLDFDTTELYFEEPLPLEISNLLHQASVSYEAGAAELPLLQAYLLAPNSLTVLVALYRFYFYQHQLQQALHIANLALQTAAKRLQIRVEWRSISMGHLGEAVMRSMGLVRFYLSALKGAGYLCCRTGAYDEGIEMLRKVASLDPADRLGSAALLDVILRAREPAQQQSRIKA
jgi:tetratricopeptide (TPR) repeat protein